MNILMLGWELPPHNSGGLGVACYNMSKALAKTGARIDFIVPYQGEHPTTDFMTVHGATKLSPLDRNGLYAYDRGECINKSLSEADINDLNDMRGVQKRYVRYVEKRVSVLKPDVIHAHDWLTMEAGMRAKELTGAPLVIHVHATEFDRSGSDIGGNPIIHEIEYRGLVAADRIIAVSDITKDIIVRHYGIPADKIEVVHNAVDVNDFGEADAGNEGTYKYLDELRREGYTVVLSLGRLTVQKGLTFLIKAAAKACDKYDKLVFLLAGDGEQRDELIELAAGLGISDKVFFTDCFVRGRQTRDAYKGSDIFVMSSVSEPFGLTALEAAHYDTAVILSKQSGVGEVLNNVLRYDFWDENTLADQIVGVATCDVLRDALKQNVKNEYDKVSWYDIAEKCVSIYEKICRQRAITG